MEIAYVRNHCQSFIHFFYLFLITQGFFPEKKILRLLHRSHISLPHRRSQSSFLQHFFRLMEITGNCPIYFFTEFSVFGDFQAVKYCWICPDFKECLQHVHVQSFSKASWAGDKVYFAPVLDKAVDHFCFIDIIEVVF